MFPGLSWAKLNSRSRRSASVFATAVVALLPSFLSLYLLLAYAYSIMFDDWLKSEEQSFLVYVSLGRPCSQLSCNPMEHCDCAILAFGTSRRVGSIQDADRIRASLL